jgi:hypothetical protein
MAYNLPISPMPIRPTVNVSMPGGTTVCVSVAAMMRASSDLHAAVSFGEDKKENCESNTSLHGVKPKRKNVSGRGNTLKSDALHFALQKKVRGKREEKSSRESAKGEKRFKQNFKWAISRKQTLAFVGVRLIRCLENGRSTEYRRLQTIKYSVLRNFAVRRYRV